MSQTPTRPTDAVIDVATQVDTGDLPPGESPYDLVRCKDTDGNEFNATRAFAASVDGVTILGKGTTDRLGRVRPDKTARELRDLTDQAGDFDPADHAVPEVIAYLDDADPAEVQRVLDLEASQDGKRRKTLAEYTPDAPADEGTTTDQTPQTKE